MKLRATLQCIKGMRCIKVDLMHLCKEIYVQVGEFLRSFLHACFLEKTEKFTFSKKTLIIIYNSYRVLSKININELVNEIGILFLRINGYIFSLYLFLCVYLNV